MNDKPFNHLGENTLLLLSYESDLRSVRLRSMINKQNEFRDDSPIYRVRDCRQN